MDPEHLVSNNPGREQSRPGRLPDTELGISWSSCTICSPVRLNGPQRRLSLPEYRQIELYTKRKALVFAPAEPQQDLITDELRGVFSAFLVLDSYVQSQTPDCDGKRRGSAPPACHAAP